MRHPDDPPVVMTADQICDEAALLVGLEHALLTEYLTISCALGYDLGADEGGAGTDGGASGASAARGLALNLMFQLKNLNRGLVDAGRSATWDRATELADPPTPALPMGPPSDADLQGILVRGPTVAEALDSRYQRAATALSALPAGSPVIDALQVPLESGSSHATRFASLSDALSPSAHDGDLGRDLLVATRREPADRFEDRLLALADGLYRLVLSALAQSTAHSDDLAAAGYRSLAVDAMSRLDDSARVLVQRHLLPRFEL